MSEADNLASFKACLHGPSVLLIRSSHRDSNLALVRSIFKCKGPALVVVINGKLMFTETLEDRAILVFSASSRILE